MKVAFIDLDGNSVEVKEVEAQGPVSLGLKVHEEVGSWRLDPLSPRSPLVVGMGRFVGGRLIGTHRIVAVFKSPMTRGLHASALGGAAYKMMGAGIDAYVVVGKAQGPVAVLSSQEGIKIEPVKPVYDYQGLKGAYAFTKYLFDVYREFFVKNNARAVVVGPAAWSTYNGALVSIDVNPKGEFSKGAEDFAARGGPGTVAAQGHNLAAIIAGGKARARYQVVSDIHKVDEIARVKLKKNYLEALQEKTVKYRYDPSLGTGGTFGVNYVHYRDLLPLFGYKSIYMDREERIRHVDAILRLFWKPFNELVFEKARSWYNCGEPCPVTCKKVWQGKKVDYEPFHAMGPFIGVYTFEDSVKLVDEIDAYGLDAIEMGHVTAWLFDAVEHGLLTPSEVGISDKPAFDPAKFQPEVDSKRNAKLAGELLRAFVEGGGEAVELTAKLGIRRAARELDRKFADRTAKAGVKFKDLAVFVAYGEDGYMTPNFYWAPGMVAPMYVQGKYWTNYNPTFMPPEEFAKTAYDRAVMEALIEDAGICRFHRGWAEPIIEDLFRLTGWKLDRDVYKKFAEYSIKAGADPRPWESKRAMDVVSTMARELGAKDWKFDTYEAYMEWWRRYKDALDKLIGITRA
ncbi:MAG: aldehyde ferredoxin oxidoreductase N-terminal domain-containing protein [Thermoproteus sp.]